MTSLTYDSSKPPLFPFKTSKNSGCQERHWYPLRASRNRSDAHLSIGSDALYDSVTVYCLQAILFLRKLCGLTSSCKQKWFMDLSGSAVAWRIPCVSATFGCHSISQVHHQSETILAHSTRTYHWGLERAWQFGTTWDLPAGLWGCTTHSLVYLWGLLLAGGMTEKEITSLCCLSTFVWIFPTISAVQ